jgi:hypothetical protein
VAAKVLFFGQDTRRRIPALKRAGYCVTAYASVVQMHPSIVEDPDAVAVAISGMWKPFLHDPISVTRTQTRIPFVLFASQELSPAQSMFDLVVPASRPPSRWLREIDLLIRECQETRADARRAIATSDLIHKQTEVLIDQSRLGRERARLERESSALAREQSRLEQERSSREISRNIDDLAGRWGLEQIPGIADFATAPPVSIGPCEERDRLDWSIMIGLATLTNLLWKIVKVPVGTEISNEIGALLLEEKGLAENLEALLTEWKKHRASHGC